jgi:small subunit ribosomal protein S1
MSKASTPESSSGPLPEANESFNESFEEIFTQYEQRQSRMQEDVGKQRKGTVIAVSSDSVFVDIGFKSEGILALAVFPSPGEIPRPGDTLLVSVKGRDLDGYYELSRTKVAQPTDWSSLEQAFTAGAAIAGTVTALVKGGFSVDVGIRAFMPASRSGVRDAAEMAKLVGQEIRCRIIKLDAADEDVVVDRRVIAEEEDRSVKDRRYAEIQVGSTASGTVRSLTDYGAFVDLGGVDALLHVSDLAWARVNKPADVLSVGQPIEVQVLKISNDAGKRRISVGLKQLQPHPWDAVPGKYRLGERVRGTVTRVLEFGAFVELEPGIEGLIHVSEMSWAKKVRIASDVLKPGETVDAVILGLKAEERRISLGLKQTLGDPWLEVSEKFPVGSSVEGPVTSITKFGAFVQAGEGVEGMIHVTDIAEKHLHHPQEVLRVGQLVRAQVLAVDREKRQLRLGMKQLVPTSLDEYLAEHSEGDAVGGRVIEMAGESFRVELGEGIHGFCRMAAPGSAEKLPSVKSQPSPAKPDVSSLSSMLQARWKGSAPSGSPTSESVRAGQVRNFRIAKLDPATKRIELDLA